MIVFHYLSYAFYNNTVLHLLSSCFLPAGEYSYLGTTLRQVDIEPMPSLADVRQLIALYGILPLGKSTAKLLEGRIQWFASCQKHIFLLALTVLINCNLKHFAV